MYVCMYVCMYMCDEMEVGFGDDTLRKVKEQAKRWSMYVCMYVCMCICDRGLEMEVCGAEMMCIKKKKDDDEDGNSNTYIYTYMHIFMAICF